MQMALFGFFSNQKAITALAMKELRFQPKILAL